MIPWTKLTIALIVFFTSVGAQAGGDRDNELALIASWLDAQRAYDHVPGISAAIVHDQELLWSGAADQFGRATPIQAGVML